MCTQLGLDYTQKKENRNNLHFVGLTVLKKLVRIELNKKYFSYILHFSIPIIPNTV